MYEANLCKCRARSLVRFVCKLVAHWRQKRHRNNRAVQHEHEPGNGEDKRRRERGRRRVPWFNARVNQRKTEEQNKKDSCPAMENHKAAKRANNTAIAIASAKSSTYGCNHVTADTRRCDPQSKSPSRIDKQPRANRAARKIQTALIDLLPKRLSFLV
jgi:hypothetical protein